jgi:DNA-binding GntR family transcriptional regulator
MKAISKTMRKDIVKILQDDILSGFYKPGERIREEELVSRLDVSRTPIREALLVLEQEGLVEIKPHRGVFVASFTPNEIVELLRIEAAVEGLAASLAAENASEEEIEALENLLQEAEAHVSNGFAPEDFYAYDREFHHLLISSTGSEKIIRVLEKQLSQIYLCRYYTYSAPNRFPHSIKEHRHIVECIKQRKPELAEHAARNHLESVIADYINANKQGKGSVT